MAPKIIKNQTPFNSNFHSRCFESRKDCILKKAKELSILCDIKTCALILAPDGNIHTFPENRSQVQEVLKLQNQNIVGHESSEALLKMVDEKLDSVNTRLDWLKKSRIDQEFCMQNFDGDYYVPEFLPPVPSNGFGASVPSVESIAKELIDDFEDWMATTESDASTSCTPNLESQGLFLEDNLGGQSHQETDDDGYWGSLPSILRSMEGEPTLESLDSIFQSIDGGAGCCI